MSVKERVQRPEVRPVIDSLFPKPAFTATGECIAPPRTENYAELGAAFNYLFSFWLSINHPNTEVARWPTDAGLTTIAREYESYTTAAEHHIETAETALTHFIETGEPTADLCKAALDLARIEAAYHGDRPRAISLLRRLGEYDDDDVADLLALYRAIPSQFADYDHVLVNPEFGPVEIKVGGIDADLVCDGTLIDIKTTKDLSLKINYWRKLVGYATLADAAHSMTTTFGELEETVPKLDRVGIYFSRYGTLWTVPTDEIYQHEKFTEFNDWFINRVA